MQITYYQLIKRARIGILIIIAGLAISGITALPLESELKWLTTHTGGLPLAMQSWLKTVYDAIWYVNMHYPFLSYGTDWLAFAHVMLAVLFIGPYREPVKNIWVLQFGMIACLAIFPLAFIAGNIRGIPFFWQLIDCSFGAIGIIPLYISYKAARKAEYLFQNKLAI
ncbi:hypothetical protein EOD41_17145 [Mucilaginibacter limnophilus]|uniref:Uncharacterized protein n=1 Tax=Mucilaginibacter limnophilus TaxID=1932778 RepID=A0A3S2VL21_9SPHI|nr:hypothetical protein [Mucilaginibacter limnophilus]RVT98512.1 hypothetical protein EOD41_17145 [Mucilaginibacter limnophilus]